MHLSAIYRVIFYFFLVEARYVPTNRKTGFDIFEDSYVNKYGRNIAGLCFGNISETYKTF